MAARVINLVVDQGVDFEATFTIQNTNGSPLNLTGYTAESKMKKTSWGNKILPVRNFISQ